MIATDRLDLEPLTPALAEAIVEGRPDVAWAPGFPREDDQDAARMWRRSQPGEFGTWVIIERGSGLAVGTIGFFGPPDSGGEAMIGYGLVESARGRGFATEALRALVGYAFERPSVARLTADPDLDNEASHRVLRKAGFRHTHSTPTAHWYAISAPIEGVLAALRTDLFTEGPAAERVHAVVRTLDVALRRDPVNLELAAVLARAVAAVGPPLLEQTQAPTIAATLAAAQSFVDEPTTERYDAYVARATASYPYGPGEGCHAIGECDGTANGCASGAGTLAQVAAAVGADVVLDRLRAEFRP